jgi:type IV secretory pathway VirB3-like protein
MKRYPIFLALTRASRLIGLPYGYAILMMVVCVLPLIWFLSALTLVWCVLVYVVLRIASAKDDKLIEAILKRMTAVSPSQGRAIWGGDSFGP